MSEKIQESSQPGTEGENQEPTNDQANQQGQITEKLKEMEARFKSELSGLNRKISEKDTELSTLRKSLKEKEKETMTAEEQAKAYAEEIEQARAEKDKIEAETNQLRRQRIIDNLLNSPDVHLPVDVFEKRIHGETEEEIKNDIEQLNAFVKAEIEKGIEAEVNLRLSGRSPQSGKVLPVGKSERIQKNIESGGRGAMEAIFHEVLNE